MEYTIEQVGNLLDEIAEQFPPLFFEELNGGILLQEERKEDPLFPDGEILIMGEYLEDGYLGSSIHLYYGSFLATARNGNWDAQTWQEELFTTLAHEFTHHMESRANTHGLDDQDDQKMLQFLEDYRSKEAEPL